MKDSARAGSSSEADVARATARKRLREGPLVERILARLAGMPHSGELEGIAGASVVTSLVDHLLRLNEGEPKPRREGTSLAEIVRELPAPIAFVLHNVAVEEICRSLREGPSREPSSGGEDSAALDFFLLATKDLREAYAISLKRSFAARVERELDGFIAALLDNDVEFAVLENRAVGLSLDLRTPVVALAFQPPSAGAGWEAPTTASALAVLSSIGSSAAVGRHGESLLAFVSGEPDWRKIEATLGTLDVTVGAGLPAVGVLGMRRSAREALRTVTIARGAAVPGRLFLYRRLMAYDFIRAGSRFSRVLARRLLGGVAEDAKALVTLREFCRHGYNVKLAAAALGIHPHTLTYRLAGMRDHQGLDLVSAEGRLAVHLALLAHEVEGVTPPEEILQGKTRG